ncbi:hypothetical protein ACLB2K_025455 [Fragaria x ananassa]
MVRSLLSAIFSSRPSSAVKPPETVTLVPKASPSSLLHCWIGGASSGAAVRDKSSSKTPPVRIRCRSNFSFLRSPFVGSRFPSASPSSSLCLSFFFAIVASLSSRPSPLFLRDRRLRALSRQRTPPAILPADSARLLTSGLRAHLVSRLRVPSP